MPRKGSSIPFNKRKHIITDEKQLFFGDESDFDEFKKLMEMPIERDGSKKLYRCKQPLQIRIMGNLDQVRSISKKIKDNLNIGLSNIGLNKLECDKKHRDGRFCSNTIRVYMNVGKGKPTCREYDMSQKTL